jgi:TIR domain
MAGGIFISYRREDSRDVVGRLADRLRRSYAEHDLFLDIDTVTPGSDFAQTLADRVNRCQVMLAVIGPGWLTARKKDGARRLDDPKDYVRSELAAALGRGVPVIPVLVSGAALPDAANLPDDLKGLAMRQKVDLRYERFNADADALISVLRGIVPPRMAPIRIALLTGAATLALAAIGVIAYVATRPPAPSGPTAAASPAPTTAAGAAKFVELCTEASEAAATLASTTDRAAWSRARERFWVLYNGPLYAVETAQKQRSKDNRSELEESMVLFGRELPADNGLPKSLPMGQLQVPSLRIAKACTEVYGHN